MMLRAGSPDPPLPPVYSQELKAAFSARTGHGNTPEALFREESFAYDPASNLLTGTDDDLR